MPSSQDSLDYDGDLKSLESIVENLRTLVKKAYTNATKERNRADDLEKKMKKLEKQSEKTQKLKRQPFMKHSKNQPNALDETVKAKDEEIEELRTFQKMLEKINADNKQTIENLRKDVRELNLELATKNFMSENCENIEEIHKIYNSELKKLEEELRELKENEDQWKEWPKLKKAYENEIKNMNEQLGELEEGTDEWKERINEYETEIDRLNSELNKRNQPWKEDVFFNGSAGLLMAGHGITQSNIDFIVQDNVEELRDSYARDLGTVIPSEIGTNRRGDKMRYSSIDGDKDSPFGKEEYIKELEKINDENMKEIDYLKDRIEACRDYEDGDILKEIEELKNNHQEEIRQLNEEIAMLRSCENGDIWLEVEELKRKHGEEVDRLQGEIEELKIFEGGDISEEVQELKMHHLLEVESLRKELEILRQNESGDMFEDVENSKKKKKHSRENNEDELNCLQEERDEEWALLVTTKEREIDSLKNEIEFLEHNEGKVGRWNENPDDVSLLSNEIKRLNGIIQLMSENYVPALESPNIDDKCPDSKPDAVLDPATSQGSTTKELEALKRVGDEATRADIQREYEEKMYSLQAEMFALKNIENGQIWKNAQEHIDKELGEIKKDFLVMSAAKDADEWTRSMHLYDEMRRLKSELQAKDKKESTEIGRLREEVRYLKQELSNLRKANKHSNTQKGFSEKMLNTEERPRATNPFFETNEDEYSNQERGDEDEEMWNLNNQVKHTDERLSAEKMKLEKEIEALKRENSELRRQMPDDILESLDQPDPNKAYTDDEKLANIIKELDQADEKATNYERQLEEERSQHSEEIKKMANDLRSLQESIDTIETSKVESVEKREEEIKNLKNELDDVKCQHEQEIKLIGEMCKEKTDALDEKISDLKISLGTREIEIAKRVQEIAELLEKLEALENETGKLNTEIQNKVEEVEKCEELINDLRSEIEGCKHEVKKTLSEQEKTYALYQAELGRVHIDLLKTKMSQEALSEEMGKSRKRHAEELVLQKEELEEKFANFIQELKKSHEDETDQIRIEMLSAQYKFKEYIMKMKHGMLSDYSIERMEDVFSGLSRNSSLDSDEKKSTDEHHLGSIREGGSKSDTEIFTEDILFEDDGFERSSNVNHADDLGSGVRHTHDQHPQRSPFISRQQSPEDRMTQSLEELDNPDNSRKDERKLKSKKKSNKSKWRARDLLPTSDEENLDDVELKEKQKQCRQQ